MKSREFMVGQFTGLVRDAATHGASLIGIDSLSTYFHAAMSSETLRIQLLEVLDWLRSQNVATLMTLVQPGIFGEGRVVSHEISEIADSVVLLKYFEDAGRLKRVMSVIKRRYGPHQKTIRELEITANGIWVKDELRDLTRVLTGQPDPVSDDPEASGNAGS